MSAIGPDRIYLSKAEESLATAESEFAGGRYNSCANRCYYSCFQAAIAALLRARIVSQHRSIWDHGYVQAEFIGQLVNRRKTYSARFRTTLAQNRELRDRADYSAYFVTEVQARRALERCRALVAAVREEFDTDE